MEEIAFVPESELLSVEEFDEDIVKELRNRARDVLLTQAIASEEAIETADPGLDLLGLDGMTDNLAAILDSHGITTRDDLAELAVDELLEIEDMGEEAASKLIMAARAHWFEEADAKAASSEEE